MIWPPNQNAKGFLLAVIIGMLLASGGLAETTPSRRHTGQQPSASFPQRPWLFRHTCSPEPPADFATGFLWKAGLVPRQISRFLDARQYNTAGFTQSVAVGDFNGDGIADMVTAGSGNSTSSISVLLGRGDGTFLPAKNYLTANGPISVAVGDFNGDGHLDVVTANLGIACDFSNTVSVLLGNGDGTFQKHREFEAGSFPASVAVGDFNGDGRIDLVVANSGSNTVSVLVGNGDGTFQASRDYATGGKPVAMSVADLNGDTHADLAVANFDEGSVSVLLGRGDGTFQPRHDYAAGAGPSSVAVADLNGDGSADLAVANAIDETVSIFLGNGNGTFQPRRDHAAGDFPMAVVVARLNQNNNADLVVADLGGDVGVLLGDGSGDFRSRVDYGAGRYPIALAVGEFNGDGNEDIAVANSGDPAASVLLGNGDGTLRTRRDFATGGGPASVAVGDFNGDRMADLVVANSNSQTVSILLGNGAGTFQPQMSFATPNGPVAVAVGDFNGDGNADLVVAASSANEVGVLLGNGDGTLQAHMDYATGEQPSSVAVGDFNGDGKLDLVTANDVETGTVSVLLGNGDGTFKRHADYATGAFPASVAVADFNGDGKLDLAVANSNPFGNTDNSVSVLLGNGDGTFQPKVVYSLGDNPGGPVSVAVSDFNGDGHTDLVLADLFRQSVSVLLGNGDGTFRPHADFPAGSFPNSVAIADFTGDGRLDLVVSEGFFFTGETVSVLFGNGDGTFQRPVSYETGYLPVAVAVGDFNGDHAPDVAAATQLSDTVSVLLNTGGTQITLTSSPNPSHPGERVTFTATVTPTVNRSGVPNGTVILHKGTHELHATLVNGSASFTTPFPRAGKYRFRVSYSGDGVFNRNTSPALVQEVK